MDDRTEYWKAYYQSHKEKHKKSARDWYIKNRKRAKARRRKYYQRLREELNKKFGNYCFVCGGKLWKKRHYHEIHGKSHERFPKYVLDHPEDFIVLCPWCHNSFHRYIEFKSKFQELEKIS